MSRRKHHNKRNANPFLIQMRFYFLGQKEQPCQSALHQFSEHPQHASWDVRIYQNVALMLQLQSQGMLKEQIDQKLWDAACHEQDTIGLVTHKAMLLCSACAEGFAVNHVGENPARLALMTVMVTGGSFLLVSRRDTEAAAIIPIAGLHSTPSEDEILEKLRQSECVIPIGMKE